MGLPSSLCTPSKRKARRRCDLGPETFHLLGVGAQCDPRPDFSSTAVSQGCDAKLCGCSELECHRSGKGLSAVLVFVFTYSCRPQAGVPVMRGCQVELCPSCAPKWQSLSSCAAPAWAQGPPCSGRLTCIWHVPCPVPTVAL